LSCGPTIASRFEGKFAVRNRCQPAVPLQGIAGFFSLLRTIRPVHVSPTPGDRSLPQPVPP
ncbi:MAG: hypothetical protein ACKN9U_13435, partial [Pirellulaceae bacterium]